MSDSAPRIREKEHEIDSIKSEQNPWSDSGLRKREIEYENHIFFKPLMT